MKKVNALLLTILLLMVLFVTTCILAGCTSTKQISKSSTKVDSTASKEKDEEIRVLKAENDRLNAEINRMQYSTVVFDSTKCPPTQLIIDSTCNVDSVKQVLERQFQNQVKIYSDGTIEAKGNLKSANFQLLQQIKLAQEKSKLADSLSKALTAEKANVKKVVEVKEKEVKRTVFPGFMWGLLLIAFGGGYYVRGRFGNIFTNKKQKI